MLMFRDWLRSNAADRDLYARAKVELDRKKQRMLLLEASPYKQIRAIPARSSPAIPRR